MGGFGSGRWGGGPTVETSLIIDLASLLRKGRARQGGLIAGTLSWSTRGQPICSINYRVILEGSGAARLELDYGWENKQQTVSLCHTAPNYGGKRWWMICPREGVRVGKLYLPSGGDRFASRQAWQLGYQSQRSTEPDRALDRLSELQRKLGCAQHLGAVPQRPKGMWQRTYKQHLEQYWKLEKDAYYAILSLSGSLLG